MDIHPPMGKVKSLKEFFTHILIVTIGILIALALEGIRESWHEHVQVREARESFQEELGLDQKQLSQDQASVHKAEEKVDKIIAEFPQLTKSPDELEKRIHEIQPGFYFFRTTAWESAMSSGALAHMNRGELGRYMDAYMGVKDYQDFSRNTIPQYLDLVNYFESHHSFDAREEAEGEQKLRALKSDFQLMEHLGQEMSSGINDALKAQ